MTSDYLLHIAAMIAIFLRAKNLGIAIKMKNKRMIWKESLIIALVVCVWIIVYRANTQQPPTKTTTTANDQAPLAPTKDSIPAAAALYTQGADSVLLAPFEIEIALSEKAKQRIAGSKETIMLDVFIQGEPKDTATAKFEEDGSFFVASASREISYGQTARFDNIRIPKSIFDQLVDKDAELSLNVYTGRHSSPNNLITGDFLSDKLSKVLNQKFTLQYKLIEEDH